VRIMFWLYACKLGLLCLVLAGVFTIFKDETWGAIAFAAAFGIILTLAVTGGLMGVLMLFGRLRMRCPDCGEPGPVGCDRKTIWIDCRRCGRLAANVFRDFRFHKEE